MMLLAVLWARWGGGDGGVQGAIQKHAAKSGKSLTGVIRTFDSQRKSTCQKAFTQVIRRHVVSDHLAIAGRKLAASGTFTYHFTSADGVLADGRIASYGYTNPRLRNLVRFLHDAGMHDENGLTHGGERFLHDYQPV